MAEEKGKYKIKVVKKPKGVKSREYPFNNRSIIGYKKPKDMPVQDFNDFIDQAAQDVLARYGISTIVVGVREWNELRILNEDIMKRNGWVKADRVFMYKDEVDLDQFTPDQLEQLMVDYVIPKEAMPDEEE